MKKTSLRRTLCLAMATITAVCFTACGSAKGATTNASAESAASGLAAQGIISIVDVEPETTTGATNETTTTGATNDTTTTGGATTNTATAAANRKFQGTIVDKYPDADFIESIADGKFVVLFRDVKQYRTNGVVYDINSDKELNSFTIYNCDTYSLCPVIFYGQGFGFITPHSGSKPGVYAYYYDTDGNLVNKYDRKNTTPFHSAAVLAPDGSALYVVDDDRVQCACGYDLKPDYTTQIYKVNPDGSEEKLAEYDSHYIIYPMEVTTEGRLVLVYNYNSMDKTGLSHQDYERLGMLANRGSEGDAYIIENGYAFMDTNKDASHDLDKFYLADKMYTFNCIRGNSITIMDNEEIINFTPDANGQYKGYRYKPSFKLSGGSYDTYPTANGEYIVFSAHSQDLKDTTINVLHFENDNIDLIFEKTYAGYDVKIDRHYERVFLDVDTGDLFARLDETADDGARDMLYHENIFVH